MTNGGYIKGYAACRGVKLWQVATALAMTEPTFLKKISRALSDTEQKRIISAINSVAMLEASEKGA